MATKIRQSNIDPSVITGQTELTAVPANDDVVLIYDSSSGSIKKIQRKLLLGAPTVSSVSPTNVLSGDGTGNHTFTITGTDFDSGASANLVNDSGTTVNFDTVTRNSATQITGVIAKASLLNSGEPFDVTVTNGNGQSDTLENQINLDASPVFNTASGSLGTINDGSRSVATIDIEAQDPESTGNVTFEIQSGSLPAGTSTTTVNENGVSKFRLSGFSAVGSNTTSNFVIRAVDAASNTSSRAFSLVIQAPQRQTFTSSGTFTVPTGYLALSNVLVVAGGGPGGPDGGGAGAGGLIYMPGLTVTPGTPITVTVGDGGSNGSSAGQDSVFSTLTAKGGGARSNGDGGSGGGVGRDGGGGGGQGIQPTQPGNSGAYGFGNDGGVNPTGPGGWKAGGGGGGAGAAGTNAMGSGPGNGQDGQPGRPGGDGKAYTIADGTTSVYYAGGGGGSARGLPGGSGGQGGGGSGSGPGGTGQAGTANRGGGAGSPQNGPNTTGGKGIVIVEY